MKKNKYSSEWIAEQDAKHASAALKSLENALKHLGSILSNSQIPEKASQYAENALKAMKGYRPFQPVNTSGK